MATNFDDISDTIWQEMRDGTIYQQPNPNDSPYTNDFWSTKNGDKIKFKELVEFIGLPLAERKDQIFNWEQFAAKEIRAYSFSEYAPPMTYSTATHFTYTNDKQQRITINFEGRLNKKLGKLEAGSANIVSIDTSKKQILLSRQWYYKGSGEKKIDIPSTATTLDFDLDDVYTAIELTTESIEDFCYFTKLILGEKALHSVQLRIAEKFITKIKNEEQASNLNFLYENLPDFALLLANDLIPAKLAFTHLDKLKQYDNDNGWFTYAFKDSSGAIINLLKVIGNSKALYDYFQTNPSLVRTLYYNLNGSSQLNNYIQKNTSIFAFLMAALCLDQDFSSNGTKLDPRAALPEFYVGGNYRLNSNVIEDRDKYHNKIFLSQERMKEKREEVLLNGEIQYVMHRSRVQEGTEGNYFPLQPVKLISADDKKAFTIVPAIFVKAISDEAEWDEISTNIRIGLDVLAIIAGVVTFGSSMLLSSAEIALATGDIFVQTAKEDILKMNGGPEFLEAWEKIFFAGGVALAGPFLVRTALKGGTKLLTAITKTTVIETLEILRSSVQDLIKVRMVNSFAYFKVTLLDTANAFWSSINRAITLKQLQKLKDIGCLFVSIDDGSNVAKYAILYNGEVIVQGALTHIKNVLNELLLLKKENIISKLDEWTDCEAVFENSAYQNIYDKVLASRQLATSLTVEEEAIIIFYTTAAFDSLNSGLRGLTGMTPQLTAFKNLLNRALFKLPKSIYNSAKFPLYRSLYLDEKIIENIRKTGNFTDAGFFSTSYNYKMFLNNWLRYYPHHNVIFKVFGKNGKLIDMVSDIPEEFEVLFASGTEFKASVPRKIVHPIDPSKEIIEIILTQK